MRKVIWLLGPPTVVVAALLGVRDLAAVFFLYQVGFCLLAPLVASRVFEGRSFRDHLTGLTLIGPGSGRGAAVGLLAGAVLCGLVIAVFAVGGELFLAEERIGQALAGWGVTAGTGSALLIFMVLVSGPAEELYWRGFIHRRFVGSVGAGRDIALIAACYASYHAVTLHLLLGDVLMTILGTLSVWAAGFVWGWWRQRCGSVWGPVLSHAGAVAGYMIVARPYLTG